MSFRANRGSLPEDFPYSRDRVFFFDPAKKAIEFAPGVVVPTKPFWGVIGVAPPPSMGRVPSVIVATKGLPRDDVLMLLSAAMDLHVTEIVDGTKGVHAMLPKSIFQK